MAFLDAQVDLAGTLYNEADLAWARAYLVELLSWEDLAWLQKPVGGLARDWLASDVAAVCRLIDFARTFARLEQGGVTPESRPALFHKLHALLRKIRERHGQAIAEALTELHAAALLAELSGRALLLEPRILELPPPASGQKPFLQPVTGAKLIDLVLPAPGQNVFAEITVLNFDALTDWERAAYRLRLILRQNMWLEGCERRVMLELPFEAHPVFEPNGTPLSNRLLRALMDKMFAQPEGGEQIELPSGKHFRLAWGAPTAVLPSPPATLTITPDELITCILPHTDSRDFEEALLKSLRNSLRVKREQSQDDIAPLLVIRAANPLITPDRLLDIIARRLWKNGRFTWLCGIALYLPRTTYEKDAPGSQPSFIFTFNPNTRYPLHPAAQAFLKELETRVE